MTNFGTERNRQAWEKLSDEQKATVEAICAKHRSPAYRDEERRLRSLIRQEFPPITSAGGSEVTIEQLRSVHQATPFRSFTIHLVDGRQISVPHREFLSHSASGRTMIVHHKDDSFSVIDLLLVTELEVHNGPVAASKEKRGE
jgi:hypothetical protein